MECAAAIICNGHGQAAMLQERPRRKKQGSQSQERDRNDSDTAVKNALIS